MYVRGGRRGFCLFVVFYFGCEEFRIGRAGIEDLYVVRESVERISILAVW